MSGLTVAEVLQKLDLIERAIGAVERSAPRAFAAFGGREAMLAVSEMTCIGPVPRLTSEQWAPFMAEGAWLRREQALERDTRVKGPRVGVAGQEPGVDVHPSRRAGPMFGRA